MAENPGNSTLPTNGEKLFVVLTLLLSTGAFMNLRVAGPIQGGQGQNSGMVGMQILWSLVYLVAIGLFLRRSSHPFRRLSGIAPLFAVVGFALASASWSQDPALTIRRSVALILTLVFGVYFASRFELKEQLRLLAWACAICIFFSFFFQLLGLNPDVGTPGWYGAFYIKNELGRTMALSALIFLFWGKVEPEHRGLARAGFLASIALIALSRSMTAVVAFGLVLALLPYLQWTLRKSPRWAVGGIVFLLTVGGVALVYVATHMEQVTDLLGKSATLTGRVPLWILSFVMALRQPWLGYGFNAFWLPDGIYVQRIWNLLHWQPPHAHNGFLELWLELGLIGTGIFLLVFVYYVARALRYLRQDPKGAAAWPLIFLVFLLLENLTETVFLVNNSVYLILYASIAATICSKPSESRVAGRLPLPEQHHA